MNETDLELTDTETLETTGADSETTAVPDVSRQVLDMKL